ncbi:MAG: hypothetical protein Q4F97_05770 [Bacteroidales bacterium]|nr:hypothetical protein [Bacteroidales bacterium]
MKILKSLAYTALMILPFTSCESGIEFEEVPESVYNEVGLSSNPALVEARELMKGKVCQIYYNGQPYVDYIARKREIEVSETLTEVDDANAPEGKLYRLTIEVPAKVTYSSPNKGNIFVASKFSSDAVVPEFSDPFTDSGVSGFMSATYPTDLSRLVLLLNLADYNACSVKPQNGAPTLGEPGDYSKPQQYIVINENKRPDGSGQRKRLYELVLKIKE